MGQSGSGKGEQSTRLQKVLKDKFPETQIYNLGVLAGQTNLTLGYVANAAANSGQTNTFVYIGSSLLDPNTNNNQAAASVAMVPPTAVRTARRMVPV